MTRAWLVLLAVGPLSCPGPFPPPKPDPPPPVYTLRVEVFEGDAAQDNKVPGASVCIDEGAAGRVCPVADGAGNIEATLAPGTYPVQVTMDGYLPHSLTVTVPESSLIKVELVRVLRQVRGRLIAQGRALTYPDGQRFRWRGATGFALLEQVAHGREADAVRFLTWARDTGFNLVRVLAMCAGWLVLSPQEGVQALDRLLTLARQYDLYVEVVALAETAKYPGLDLHAHVRAIGQIAARHDNALVEVANEHYHASQVPYLHDVKHLAALEAEIPAEVPSAQSASRNDEALEPGGRYITRHLSRTRDPWNMVRRVRELENVSHDTGRHVVNDEPIGAAETMDPGRRLDNPAIFLTFGLLSRIFEVGSTFHFEDGLRALVPGPVQQRCAEAFILGTRIRPDEVLMTFANAGWSGSPVESANWEKVVRVYSGVTGGESVSVALGLTGDPAIAWNWSPVGRLLDAPGVDVWEVRR